MTTRFVRQFIKQFPNNYMEYVNFMSNLEGDIETGIANSNKAPVIVTATFRDIKLEITLQDEMIKSVKYTTTNRGSSEMLCNFRHNTFTEIVDTLLVMLLLPYKNGQTKH